MLNYCKKTIILTVEGASAVTNRVDESRLLEACFQLMGKKFIKIIHSNAKIFRSVEKGQNLLLC